MDRTQEQQQSTGEQPPRPTDHEKSCHGCGAWLKPNCVRCGHCRRVFCRHCLGQRLQHLNMDFDEARTNTAWACPVCQGVCCCCDMASSLCSQHTGKHCKPRERREQREKKRNERKILSPVVEADVDSPPSSAPSVPEAPREPSFSNITPHSVRVSWWDPPTDSVRPEFYVLEMARDGESFREVFRGPNTTHTANHLQPRGSYRFRVCGGSRCGFGRWSAASLVTLAEYHWHDPESTGSPVSAPAASTPLPPPPAVPPGLPHRRTAPGRIDSGTNPTPVDPRGGIPLPRALSNPTYFDLAPTPRLPPPISVTRTNALDTPEPVEPTIPAPGPSRASPFPSDPASPRCSPVTLPPSTTAARAPPFLPIFSPQRPSLATSAPIRRASASVLEGIHKVPNLVGEVPALRPLPIHLYTPPTSRSSPLTTPSGKNSENEGMKRADVAATTSTPSTTTASAAVDANGTSPSVKGHTLSGSIGVNRSAQAKRARFCAGEESFPEGAALCHVVFPCRWKGCQFRLKSLAAIAEMATHIDSIHLASVTGPFTCLWESCDTTFTDREALVRHTRTHPVTPSYQCPHPTCQALMDRPVEANDHVLHTHDKPFLCSVTGCGRAFATKAGLTSHSRLHTSLPFPCPQEGCHATFRYWKHLEWHKLTHEGNQFVCATCGEVCSSFTTLKSHQRVHSKEREVTCIQCGRRFLKRATLMAHIRSEHMGGGIKAEAKPMESSHEGINGNRGEEKGEGEPEEEEEEEEEEEGEGEEGEEEEGSNEMDDEEGSKEWVFGSEGSVPSMNMGRDVAV